MLLAKAGGIKGKLKTGCEFLVMSYGFFSYYPLAVSCF
jgi:hypothetical protein